MAILILVGLAVQGIFGVAAGILVKKNRQFVKWSVTALVIELICIVLFYVGLAGGM